MWLSIMKRITRWVDGYLRFHLCWQVQHNRHPSSVGPDRPPRLVVLRCYNLRCENNYQQVSPDCHCRQQPNGPPRHSIVRTATWDCPPPCSLGCLNHIIQHPYIRYIRYAIKLALAFVVNCFVLVTLCVLNLSPPSVACMHQWFGSASVQVMACCLFGAKLLLIELYLYEQTSEEF